MTDFDFISEVKMLGYGESDTSGAWIKLQILPEELETFRGLKGEVYEIAMRNVDRGPMKPPKPEKGQYGQHAKDLVLSGFFNSGKVREFFGGDKHYQDWCRFQPSAISGLFDDHNPDTGEGKSVYAHVRRAGESGTAYKPKYSGIPMTYSEHSVQHQYGETVCLDKYEVDTKGKTAREWFEHQADKYLKLWLVDMLKQAMQVDTLTNLHPRDFANWVNINNLGYEVPTKFREKYWSKL